MPAFAVGLRRRARTRSFYHRLKPIISNWSESSSDTLFCCEPENVRSGNSNTFSPSLRLVFHGVSHFTLAMPHPS